MLRFTLAFLALVAPAPVLAQDLCDELWFVRNLAFDRAGYCFGSALGQSVFGNAGCIGKDVTLSPEAQETVNYIKDQERWLTCAVDTSRQSLDVPGMTMLRALDDLPVPTDTESACITWSGPDFPLYAGHDATARITGVVRAGDSIHWQYDHTGPEGWQILSIFRNYERTALGWSRTFINPDYCEMMAG